MIDAPKKFTERLADFKAFVKVNKAHLQENEVINAHYAELEAAFAEVADDADELSISLRKQLKELGIELSTTDLEDEIIPIDIPQFEFNNTDKFFGKTYIKEKYDPSPRNN